ncbi:hypothetical protein ACFW2D_10035 [Streptomyces sp. NPDC058914]|uniref:hypothetical protein n=1 Tax=Streptomyces sp. NPDC058914 TaxID=3346671 RepID=UPI0036B698D4
MGSEIWTGLVGLGGAVIGAGGAILGGWLQQRHQAKTAKQQRREEHRYTAGRTALDMLIRLRHVAANRGEDAESENAWTAELVEWSTSFDAALFLVPGGDEMRERVFEVVRQLGFYEALGQNHREANAWIDVVCGEAITILSAFLREDPLPSRSRVFRDRQDMIEAHLRSRTAPS